MKHILPTNITSLLEKWENLGFSCKREAAEFILANKDWAQLVKDTEFTSKELKAVNEWREAMILSNTDPGK